MSQRERDSSEAHRKKVENVQVIKNSVESKMSHNQDSAGEKEKPAVSETPLIPDKFELLMRGNFIHILEKIFLSLDYESFKNCRGVCKTWADVLDSQPLKEKAQSVFGASMWMDTEHLERGVYTVDRNIVWWTANGDEVAFVEGVEQGNLVFHFIAEDGRQRTTEFNESRDIPDIWILRHVIVVQEGWNVYTLDKDDLERRRLFSNPETGGPACHWFNHLIPGVGVRFLTFETGRPEDLDSEEEDDEDDSHHEPYYARAWLRDVLIDHNSRDEWNGNELMQAQGNCCSSDDDVSMLVRTEDHHWEYESTMYGIGDESVTFRDGDGGPRNRRMHRLRIHELALFRFNSFQLLVSHTSTVPGSQPGSPAQLL